MLLTREATMNIQYIICPHLKGSYDGAVCSSVNKLIKNIEDVTIKLCMSRHYEVCSIYRESLQEPVSAI
jgi:hypothetical protein